MGVRQRCRKHVDDRTSAVGVCASCLRERLCSLIAAHANLRLQLLSRTPPSDDGDDDACGCESNASSSPPPPPSIQIPHSVSPPYTQKETSGNLCFYGTPQAGPTYQCDDSKKRNNGKFKIPILSSIFRSKSEKLSVSSVPSSRPRISDSTSDSLSRDSWSCPSPSSYWFHLIRDKCRGDSRQSSSSSVGDSIFPGNRRTSRVSDRGLSPANCIDYEDAPPLNGCSDGSPPGGAARQRRRATAGDVSGLSLCFSPLVRASPAGNWKRKGCTTPEIGFSGELRVPMRPHLSQAASYSANRSRKLADFGKVNPNR